jgi:hypothetical protein
MKRFFGKRTAAAAPGQTHCCVALQLLSASCTTTRAASVHVSTATCARSPREEVAVQQAKSHQKFYAK